MVSDDGQVATAVYVVDSPGAIVVENVSVSVCIFDEDDAEKG